MRFSHVAALSVVGLVAATPVGSTTSVHPATTTKHPASTTKKFPSGATQTPSSSDNGLSQPFNLQLSGHPKAAANGAFMTFIEPQSSPSQQFNYMTWTQNTPSTALHVSTSGATYLIDTNGGFQGAAAVAWASSLDKGIHLIQATGLGAGSNLYVNWPGNWNTNATIVDPKGQRVYVMTCPKTDKDAPIEIDHGVYVSYSANEASCLTWDLVPKSVVL
ncbi:hypothetical protein K461DRAFT_267274 [Myriangium duriaei CBS 260.36]|uniref:Ricin B lectin domain-containing protein n=1 Tax=Myriangium duriaei CBS 260.36 TaxID=1168546 RepID=A0A9P4MP02_9PEZI|nr:hypothetical protein K461DRAFT_267274 [Myriangium duriaei CBS 260.36]